MPAGIQMPKMTFIICVTLRKFPNLSEPYFPHLVPSTWIQLMMGGREREQMGDGRK
jgi:hypothetical protein